MCRFMELEIFLKIKRGNKKMSKVENRLKRKFINTVMYLQLNIIFLILIFGLVSGCKNGMRQKIDKYERGINKRFVNAEISFPENYDSLCIKEAQNNITFPRITPSYAVLHFDKFYKPDIRLTLEQMNNIITFLNDTASYEWGEWGTPENHRIITFHDNKGDCIGITKIDFVGQTYSTPYNSKMKWGALKTNDLSELIKKIEK